MTTEVKVKSSTDGKIKHIHYTAVGVATNSRSRILENGREHVCVRRGTAHQRIMSHAFSQKLQRGSLLFSGATEKPENSQNRSDSNCFATLITYLVSYACT